MKAVIGLFPTAAEAQDVVRDLLDAGVQRDQISVVSQGEAETQQRTAGEGERTGSSTMTGLGTGAAIGGLGGLLVGLGALAIPGIGPIVAAGPLATALAGAAVGATAGGLIGALGDLGVPEEEARAYEQGVQRGGTLVTARVEDAMVDQAQAIMERHRPLDIDRYAAPAGAGESRGEAAAAAQPTGQEPEERAVPVVEEELQVGKRQVQTGGVRIYSTVSERPVEEQVPLREEHVRVERRPVDRPVQAGEDVFREEEVEMTETAEEPVVAKRARVLEEVVIDRDVGERTETVRDTVRRKDVQIDRSGAQQPPAAAFDRFEHDYRQHCQRALGAGFRYEDCQPAYRFGHALATHARFGSASWPSLEPEARRRWEERNPGTWDQFREAIRYGWDRASGQARAA